MAFSIGSFWNRISRIGLHENEDVSSHRNIILVNRVIIFMIVLFILYYPLEIYLNGFKVSLMVFLIIILFSLPLLFNYYRWFNFCRYYMFLVGSLIILGAGLSVGKGINNHISLVPLLLLCVIIFDSKKERFLMLFLSIGVFLLQQYLFEKVSPVFHISDDLKQFFSNVFFIIGITMSFFLAFYFLGINEEYENIIHQQKKKVEHMNEIVLDKQKEIIDSIAYAKRIQTALLPSDENIKSLFPESFILYKPKDIVSGDFYWINELNGVRYLAVCDCTGHGVPGALVSVVCHNSLNRSIKDSKVLTTGDVLNRTRSLVIKEFSKSNEDVKDGMDIALCSLSGNRLNFSGANNPIWIIRKGTEEIEEIKGDKQPIGKTEQMISFKTHELTVSKDDLVYLFSDGYVDQFGGENGKKFKSGNLKKLLLSIKNESIESQRQKLIEAIEDWKRDLEQVDDICLIGFKVQ